MTTIESHDREMTRLSACSFRRFVGPYATEIHLLCQPRGGVLQQQTRAAYRALHEALSLEGGDLGHVVKEVVYFRHIGRDLKQFVKDRKRVLGDLDSAEAYCPASTFIEEPPLKGEAGLALLVTAVVPHLREGAEQWNLNSPAACGCDDCGDVRVRVYLQGGEKNIQVGNVFGLPGSTFDEAYSMFRSAEEILRHEKTDFRSVFRTWIYFRDMDRDYAEFNRARGQFFKDARVTLRPASTGIGGAPFPAEHNFVLAFHAIDAEQPPEVEPMTTPLLNEAPEYGSEFSRGLKVVEANKVGLYISGTASVDEVGRTVHLGDFGAQAERMLSNVSSLLEGQGASFSNVVSATVYLKHAADVEHFREIVHNKGISSLPCVVVEADVCRPELLCEMEGIAVLPRS